MTDAQAYRLEFPKVFSQLSLYGKKAKKDDNRSVVFVHSFLYIFLFYFFHKQDRNYHLTKQEKVCSFYRCRYSHRLFFTIVVERLLCAKNIFI
jgi:hypothetical protein